MEELNISNLLELEIKTQKKWDLQKLYVDLERQKVEFSSKKRLVKLTDLQKEDLCRLLNKQSPEEIRNEGISKQDAVNRRLSEGIYKYIEHLTNEKINNWRDVFLLLENDYYLGNASIAGIHVPNNYPALTGWIWIGAVNDLTGQLPSPETPLIGIDPSFTPIIIEPSVVPKIGDIVKIIGNVNLRDSSPQIINSKVIPGNILATLTKGQAVTIRELKSYLIKNSYTGVWAEIEVS